MKEQPEDKMVTGTIKNCDTGKESNFEYYFFSTDSAMETIIKIQNVSSYVHPDDSMQISIDCLALDSSGNAFDLDLNFTPETVELRDQILKELIDGSLWMAKGEYSVLCDENRTFISLYEPEYKALPPDYELDVESAFRINRQDTNNEDKCN